MPKVPILGVIFDLDGTVADTQWIHEEIYDHLLREYGIVENSRELEMRFAGMALEERFRSVFAKARKPSLPDLKALSDRKRDIFRSRAAEFKEMPGIRELTAMLRARGVALAIASSSRLADIVLVLEKIDLRSRFKVITSTKEKECENGKPNPDVFLLAAQRLEIPPANCVVIGDAASDMAGAKAANMRRIALWKHPPTELLANLVVRDLREIPDEFFS